MTAWMPLAQALCRMESSALHGKPGGCSATIRGNEQGWRCLAFSKCDMLVVTESPRGWPRGHTVSATVAHFIGKIFESTGIPDMNSNRNKNRPCESAALVSWLSVSRCSRQPGWKTASSGHGRSPCDGYHLHLICCTTHQGSYP